MFTYKRDGFDLCGQWGFYPDPYERSIRQKWWEKTRNPLQVFPCYDEYTTLVEVPHSWNAQNIELKFYEGTCIYLKEFEILDHEKVKEQNEVWICFDGVNYHTKVYLNGHLVGTHDGGYSPFQLNITPHIAEKNKLWVVVNNERKTNRVPALIYDWWNDGGIFRPVKVIYTPKTYIDNYFVTTQLNEDIVEITFKVDVAGNRDEKTARYDINIEELDIKMEGIIPESGYICQMFRISKEKITLWEPANPKLYNIEIHIDNDFIRDEVGFREIKTCGREIHLNGKPIFLKGINFHDEYNEYGRVANNVIMDRFFEEFKELGINYIRMAHYPHAETFVRRADKEGIMLWAEIPVYWYVHWEQQGVYEVAEQMMLEMIDRDQNRASVIIWSVGNEMENKQYHADYLIKLVNATKKADATRLVSYACSWFQKADQGNGGKPGMPDWLYESFDIVSVNNYSGCNGNGKPEDMEEIINEYAKYGKPVLMSEFGAISKIGCTGENDVFSEDLHVQLFTKQITTVLSNKNIKGLSPWEFHDTRTPLYQLHQSNMICRYGFLDENFNKKKVYGVLKKIYETI